MKNGIEGKSGMMFYDPDGGQFISWLVDDEAVVIARNDVSTTIFFQNLPDPYFVLPEFMDKVEVWEEREGKDVYNHFGEKIACYYPNVGVIVSLCKFNLLFCLPPGTTIAVYSNESEPD